MVDAQERIWAWTYTGGWNRGEWTGQKAYSDSVEYIRADLATLSDAVAEREAEPVEERSAAQKEFEQVVAESEGGLFGQLDRLHSELEALRKGVAELEGDVARERRRATNAEYFNLAYHNMLGPVALKVAEMWREKNITRVHFDWGPDAAKLTGEERAQIILDFDKAPKQLVENLDEGSTSSRVREGGKVDG